MCSQRKVALEFRAYAAAYSRAAEILIEQQDDPKKRLIHDAPILGLVAHSCELYLKATLTSSGEPKGQVEQLQHDLLKLFDTLAAKKTYGEVLHNEVMADCRAKWRDLLRSARDNYSERMQEVFGDLGTTEEQGELGIHSNDVIGKELPDLRQQIIWFSDRHANGGSRFRYLTTGIDQHQVISAFGLNVHVPMQSVLWACKFFDAKLNELYFPKKKTPRQ